MRYLILFLFVLAFSNFSDAQVAVLGTPNGIAGEFVETLTLSNYEVPAGTDRLLLVNASSDKLPISVTFGGIPLTAVGGGLNVWSLVLGSNLANSDFGDIVFVVEGVINDPVLFIGLNAIAFTGVYQSDPIDGYQEIEIPVTSTSSSLIINSNINDLVFDGIAVGCTTVAGGGVCMSPPDADPIPGQLLQNNLSFLGTVFNGRGSSSIKSGASSVPVGWVFSGSVISPLPGFHVGMNIRNKASGNLSGNVGINTNSPQRNMHINSVLRLQPRFSAPNNPAEGDIYYSSTLHKLRVYDGTQWQDCW